MDPLDRDHLLQLLEGDRDLVAVVVRTFLETTPELVRATRQAVQAFDPDGVRTASHQLRGALASIGAGPAARAAAELEEAARRGATGGLDGALSALEAEMARLVPELQALVPGEDGTACGAG